MPWVKLTEKTTLHRKPPNSGQIELWDTLLPAFGVRISYGGRRTFFVMARLDGRQVRRTVPVPVDRGTLAEARAKARDMLRDLSRGIDSEGRGARREAAQTVRQNQFRNVADAYLADEGKGGAARLRSRDRIEARLIRDVFLSLGERAIGDITRADVRALVEHIARDRPVAANRTLATVRRIFSWAVRKDMLDASPAAGIEPPGVEVSRERVLVDGEIARVWQAGDELGYPIGPWLQLMMLTGQRRGEVGGMRWSEIDGDSWIIPPERVKNGRTHIVPLSPLAVSIIDDVPVIDSCEHVFTSGRARSPDRPISSWGQIKQRIDEVVAAEAREAVPHWTFQDLRRTMVTHMNERLGIEPHVVEAVVNHISGAAKAGVAGVYNRATYLPQRRAALGAWASHIEALTSGAPPAVSSVVIGFGRTRARPEAE